MPDMPAQSAHPAPAAGEAMGPSSREAGGGLASPTTPALTPQAAPPRPSRPAARRVPNSAAPGAKPPTIAFPIDDSQ